ncbi:glycosyltransferase family 4 protein [Patescibacteria group bacterium]|nr:glycosyltransferase family 4 protein [Patescibacteria group bacterium]
MKKKVVFIINNFVVGGVEKLLLDIIARLDKQKFDISIITVFGSGPLEDNFKALNVPIYFAAGKFPFYASHWLYKVYWLVIAPFIIARLVWWLRLHHPDTVVTSLYQADILGILASWLTHIRQRVLIHHDVYPLPFGKAYLKRKIGIGLSTKVVAVSQTVKAFVITYFGAIDSRVEVITNGINLELFKNNQFSSNDSGLTLGMLGRLEPIKGPSIFVQALQILQSEYGLTPTSYLGGSGSLKPELMGYASQAKLPNLHFDGEIQDVPGWMSKIDILVVPSMSEGFGLVILEGLATGKLVLASDLPSVRELVTNNINGQLFPVGDAKSLADMLHRLITDPTVFNQVKQGVSKWQQQRLSYYDIKQVTWHYEELLSSGREDQDNNGAIRP